ncbi:MAG: LacI family DNA-binding transcriptional regulator [Bacteroidota bacterium]
MGATIHDVARRAGVSISTVSRVLNQTANVSKRRRARVREAAAALGYSPNPAARSLLGRSSGSLGIVLPYITGEFFSEFLHGIDTVAQEHDLYCFVSSSHRNDGEFAHVLREIGRRADGLLIMATETEAKTLATLLPQGLPIVFVNTPPFDQALEGVLLHHDHDAIRFDNRGGAYAIAQHVIEQGARRLTVVRGPMRAYDAEERLAGIRAAMGDAGLDVARLTVVQGDYTQEAGYRAGQRIVEQGDRPDAVMACNDLCAIGVLRALREARIRVPDDVMVTGFDDTPLARYVSPPLTSAHVPIRDIGAWAVKRLVLRIRGAQGGGLGSEGDLGPEGSLRPERIMMPVALVPRTSTGYPETPSD